MPGGIESFVILADMRTGSNALEERLNDYEGVTSYGEVFNPHFIGHSGTEDLFGMSLAERDANPHEMLALLRKNTSGLAGFRLFSDHDERVRDACLSDRRCAKIVLTRSPLDSYVSLKIARATGQWWLGDLKTAKSGKAHFDADEFDRFLAARTAWLGQIRRRLQVTGQTAFWIGYEDLSDPDVIAGAARFLGARERRKTETRKGRVQNPVPLTEKVSNFAEMQAALSKISAFDLEEVPDHEPPRGPNVPSYVACRKVPLLYMPIKCAADLSVEAWMAAIDGVRPGDLLTGLTRKGARQWKRQNSRHTTFTVVCHPVVRAYSAFCRFILPTSGDAFSGIRAVLKRSYNVPLPGDPADAAYDLEAHGAAFLAFLKFLKGNLGGQTSVRIDGAWASQLACIQGLTAFGPPDAVLRAESLGQELEHLAVRLGVKPPDLPDIGTQAPFGLSEIYDDKIERAARTAYQRDYMMFGYSAWSDAA